MITHQEQYLTAHGPMKEWFDRARAWKQTAVPCRLAVPHAAVARRRSKPAGRSSWPLTMITTRPRSSPTSSPTTPGACGTASWNRRATHRRRRPAIRRRSRRPASSCSATRATRSSADRAGDSTVILGALVAGRCATPALVPIIDPAARAPAAAAPRRRRGHGRPRWLGELVLVAGARHRNATGRAATASSCSAGCHRARSTWGRTAIVDVGERHRAGDRARRRRRHSPRVSTAPRRRTERLQDDRDEDRVQLPVHEGDHDVVRPRGDSRPDAVGRRRPCRGPASRDRCSRSIRWTRGARERPLETQVSLRTPRWYDGTSRDNYIHRSWMKRGLPDDVFTGKPMIGICNSASELTPVQPTPRRPGRASSSAGVWEAGGVPLEFPVTSLGEAQTPADGDAACAT